MSPKTQPASDPGGGSARSSKPPRRTVFRVVLAVVIAVAVFGFALPGFASMADVWHAIGHVGWRRGALLAVVAGWNLVTYWLVWMAAVPNLGVWRAALVSQAPTAVANTVPGGSYVAVALTFAMLRSWRFRRSAATLAMVVTGMWNNFAKLALPVVALAALAVGGDVGAPRVVAAAVGLAGLSAAVLVFAAAMRSDATAAGVARLAAAAVAPLLRVLHRPAPHGWDDAARRFRERAGSLVASRWHLLTSATLLGHLSLFLVLLTALRATGVTPSDVGAAEVLAVFAFARLATAVPFTPGGLGVVELTLTTGLVAAGGAEAPVVAGVLVYRTLTYLVQIPLGGLAYLLWRRQMRRTGALPDRRDGAAVPVAGGTGSSTTASRAGGS